MGKYQTGQAAGTYRAVRSPETSKRRKLSLSGLRESGEIKSTWCGMSCVCVAFIG